MIKNLGKFKQWTGEKFGGAKVTLQTEDFQRLEQETEHRREGYDKVVESVDILLSYILKRKSSPEDGKTKMMPLELFGTCLYHYGTVFPEDNALGVALINVGQIETRISALQESFANEIKINYMNTLEGGIKDYKEYDSLRKKLASRRLDYDSKLNRLNKAKKEKPEQEQEMQAARIKYEDTEHDLIQLMACLQEFENEHRDALSRLIDAQLAYHNQARELLLGLKTNWGEATNETNDILGRVMPREDSFYSVSHDNISSHASLAKSQNMSRDSSVDSYQTENNNNNNNTVTSRRPSTTDLAAQEYDHFRRALFDFTGQNDDEISFKVGDVITVINEIDKGWWVGEVHNKRGIFPVNYTEPYDPQKHPLPPLPNNDLDPSREAPLPPEPKERAYQPTMPNRHQSTPNLPNGATTPNEPNHYPNGATTTPIQQTEPNHYPNGATTPIQQTEPNHYLNGAASPIHQSGTSTPIQPTDYGATLHQEPQELHLDTNIPHYPLQQPLQQHSLPDLTPTTSRRPPPPPVTTSSPSVPTVTGVTRTKSVAIRAPPPPPTTTTTTTCPECDCRDYIENVFKPGYCNNCFHKHTTN